MVTDEIWPRDAQFLCVPCLEKRVGRQLTKDDITSIISPYPAEILCERAGIVYKPHSNKGDERSYQYEVEIGILDEQDEDYFEDLSCTLTVHGCDHPARVLVRLLGLCDDVTDICT
jgi:hypothetical protein